MSRIGTASPSARLWKINPCQAYKRKDRLRKAVFSFYISLSKNSCKRPEEALLQEQKTQGLFPKFPVVARKPCDEVGFGAVPGEVSSGEVCDPVAVRRPVLRQDSRGEWNTACSVPASFLLKRRFFCLQCRGSGRISADFRDMTERLLPFKLSPAFFDRKFRNPKRHGKDGLFSDGWQMFIAAMASVQELRRENASGTRRRRVLVGGENRPHGGATFP